MRKLILVTGGTKGIGKAIIEKFAANNFDVITCSRSNSDLQHLAKELKAAYPDTNVYVYAADLTDKHQVKTFLSAIKELKRPVDVLINNAGYFVPGEICTEPEGTLESMIQIHLYSAYYITRDIVQEMKAAKRGHIFNVCSIASMKAYPNGGSYAIAKAALLGFSRCLREELKSFDIRVTALLPGATRTQSWDGVNLPEERFMKTEDIADIVYTAYAISGRSVVEEVLIRPLLGDI